MKVAFDGAPLDDGTALGVATAFLTGLRAYAERWPDDAVLLLPSGSKDPAVKGLAVVEAPRGAWRRQWHLPRLLRRLRADVLHSPVAAVPLRSRVPSIATVHDLPWLHASSGERAPLRQRLATRLALRAATIVMAPSRFTAEAANGLVPRTRAVRVVPHATPLPASPTVYVEQRNGPLLALGDDRPRKNRLRVQNAIAIARRECEAVPAACFAGHPYNVVDEAAKDALLRGCRALLHVSLYEGYGLPVLEGLAHGIPVLCSELPPHREIADDDALFVDPRDEIALPRAIVRICTDTDLRARLAANGPRRAAQFAPAVLASTWRSLHEELCR